MNKNFMVSELDSDFDFSSFWSVGHFSRPEIL